MGSIADRLSGKQKERLVTSSLSEGEVFRMHLGDEENVKGKNSGDDGRNKYFIIISNKKFTELFGKDSLKGRIQADDLSYIKTAVAEYEDASPKLLKRFGLI